MVGDSDECISAGQFAHKLVASTATATSTTPAAQPQAIALKLVHPDWNQASSWKQVLNNLRLVIQPSVILNLLLVKSISNSATISRVRVFNRADESLS